MSTSTAARVAKGMGLALDLWGAGFLWWLVGVSLLVLGALNLIRGLSLKS